MGAIEPHIRLGRDLGICYALLPGDPGRIDRIAACLDGAEELVFNREFRSLRGSYRGTRVLALSTGIGGASMAIALEELHNIGVTAVIRIGSSGSLQPGIELGELILASAAVRDDGASKAYAPTEFPAAADPDLLTLCRRCAGKLNAAHRVGLVRSHDSFYTDQEQEICRKWSKLGILGADMETAALYTVASIRGMKAASILNTVVRYEEDTAEGIDQYVEGEGLCAAGEKAEILTALEAFAALEAGL